MSILCDHNSYIPRDDYRELLQLSLHCIDKISFSTFFFCHPGPHHPARWMSMEIYSLKMLMIKDQLEPDKNTCKNFQVFGSFITCFYTANWLLSPIASEAAIQDLTFYLTKLDYSKNCQSSFQNIETAVNATLF